MRDNLRFAIQVVSGLIIYTATRWLLDLFLTTILSGTSFAGWWHSRFDSGAAAALWWGTASQLISIFAAATLVVWLAARVRMTRPVEGALWISALSLLMLLSLNTVSLAATPTVLMLRGVLLALIAAMALPLVAYMWPTPPNQSPERTRDR